MSIQQTIQVIASRNADSDDQQLWNTTVHCGDRIMGLTIQNPISGIDEPEIEWYLEEYVIDDIYLVERAKACEVLVKHCEQKMVQQMGPTIKNCIQLLNLGSSDFLRIEIVTESSSSRFQSIHWEMLENADWTEFHIAGVIVSRCLTQPTSLRLSETEHLIEGVCRILFVSARPDADRDIDYLLLSKPLSKLLREKLDESTSAIEFARPGDWLETVVKLQSRPPGYYSIVHFDLHGIIHDGKSHLVFALMFPFLSSMPVEASHIAAELTKAQVPIVVLNACNSAKARTPHHANLAQKLIESGIETVVAMSYAVLAESASIFINHFYENFLANQHDIVQSVALGRKALREQTHRRGTFGLMRRLKDHFVPVVYKSHAGLIRREIKSPLMGLDKLSLANETTRSPTIVGRDIDVLNLENILTSTNLVHVYGPGGSGKSYLVKFLAHWWVETGFFEHVFVLPGRDLFQNQSGTLQQRLESLIQNQATSSTYRLNGEQEGIERSDRTRYLVFLDGCETIDHIRGLDQYSLPVLNDDQSADLKSFLHVHRQREDIPWKIVVLSRTNTLAHAQSVACAEGDKKPAYYELKSLKSSHAVEIAETGLPSEFLQSEAHEQFALELSRMLAQHDNNAMFCNLVSMCLNGHNPTTESLQNLALEFQMSLPSLTRVHLASGLNIPNEGSLGTIADFTRVICLLKAEYPSVHRMVLTWAPFRQYSLNFFNNGAWYLNLMACEIFNDPHFGSEYRLSQPRGRAYGRRSDRLQEVSQLTPDLRNIFRDGIKILKAIGLIEDAIDLNSDIHYKLHPLLPYLLRAECERLDDSSQFIRMLDVCFLENYEFFASIFVTRPNDVPTFLEVEWLNVCRAIELMINTSDLANADIELIFALHYIPKMKSRDGDRSAASLTLLGKVVRRFALLASEVPQRALPFTVLSKVLRIADLILSISNRVGMLDGNEQDRSLSMCLDMYEESVRRFGNPPAGLFCTAFSVKTALLKSDSVTSRRLSSLRQEVWDATLDAEATEEEAVQFYKSKFFFLTDILIGRTPQMRQDYPTDRIWEKLNELQATVKSEELSNDLIESVDTILLALRGSSNAAGPAIDAISFCNAGLELVPRLRRQGLGGMDEELQRRDPISIAMVAMAARPDAARERKILLDGLHHAMIRNDRHDQRSLHWLLWLAAAEASQADNAILHLDEWVRLNRSLGAGDQDAQTTSEVGQQYERVTRECLMNLHTGKLIMDAHFASQADDRDVWKAQAMSYLQKGRDLALNNNLTNYICKAYLLLGDWYTLMEHNPDLSYGWWAKAAQLGDQVNDGMKPRPFRGNLARGGFTLLLVRAWRLAANSSKIAIAQGISEGLGREADEIIQWIDIFARGLLIRTGQSDGLAMGPRSEDYGEESLRKYFEECQQILLEITNSDAGMSFWRLETNGIWFQWTVQTEALNGAVMEAIAMGSARRRRS